MLAIVAMAIFVATCSAVGLRLVWIAIRSREVGGKSTSAAWSCGLGFTFIALLGHPMGVASGNGTALVGEVNQALAAAGVCFVAAGLAAFFAFTLTTFRLDAGWAWALTCGAILALAVNAFVQIGALGEADPELRSADVIERAGSLTGYLSTLCYAWIALEGIGEWMRARKRVALGLSDPVVADRFFMWGVFGISTTALNAFLIATRFMGDPESTWLVRQLALTGFGLVSSAAAALAFFPPKAYTRWVRARYAAA